MIAAAFYLVTLLLGAGIVLLLANLGSIPLVGGVLGSLFSMAGLRLLGDANIHQREDDEYEVRAGSRDEGLSRYWQRLSGTPFALSYEASERAFEESVYDDEHPADLVPDVSGIPGDYATIGIVRAGRQVIADTSKSWDGIVVVAGEFFEDMADVAGLATVDRTESEALEEFGGDTGNHSAKVKLVGMAFFSIMGVALGWVWFL